MSDYLISIKNGKIVFEKKLIFKNLNLNIDKGKCIAITGHNSSGKSVILKILSGKAVLTSGQLVRNFKSKEINTKNKYEISVLKNIGYLDVRHKFKDRQNQNSFFYQQRYNTSFSNESLTTIEFLYEAQKESKKNEYWDIKKVVELLNLDNLLDKNLIKLSNGESRRVRIAEILIKNPLLIFLDQPFTGIDVDNRIKFNNIFKAVTDSGITLIIACNQDEVPNIADTVVKLKIGNKPIVTSFSDFVPSKKRKKLTITTQNKQFLKTLPPFNSYKWIVKMDNVNIKYDENIILKNINWQIKQGERWSLYGPNGAGKSTLLSLITGDNPQAYSNNIILFDKKRGSGESIWDIKRKIGFVSPELFQFFPQHFTCEEAISTGYTDFFIKPKKISDTQKSNIAKWIDILKISEFKEEPLRKLPITVQRLTLLARALVKNPPLLILDEPCQGFDNQQQSHFSGIIDIISNVSNITWIYVTHKKEQLPKSVTNHLLLTKNGEIEI